MNCAEANKIIQESRELEGVGVDLGDDAGDSSFMVSRLHHIKSLIEQEEEGTLEHAQLVDRYNTLLYVLMCFLEYEQYTLQPSHEIDEKLILQRYLEYKTYLNEHGLYTLLDKIKKTDIVAMIEVLSVRGRDGERITIRPIDIFKGTLHEKEEIEVCTSWGNIYQCNNKYLVFYDKPTSGRIVSVSSNDWLIFIEKSLSLYLLGKRGQAFWPVESLKSAPILEQNGFLLQGEYQTLVPWAPLREWLKNT